MLEAAFSVFVAASTQLKRLVTGLIMAFGIGTLISSIAFELGL